MGFTPINSIEEANAQLSQLWDQISLAKNKQVSLHGRTVTGGAPSYAPTDYVTKQELAAYTQNAYKLGTTTPKPIIPTGIKWVLSDTHAHRVNYPAGRYTNNVLYYETDRQIFYYNLKGTWTYADGVMKGATGALPGDLGTADAGFLFIDTTLFEVEEWNGTSWVVVIHGAASTVTSVTGTAGEITATNVGGAVTLSLPVGAWTVYGPTVTASAGTVTVSYTNCRYGQLGKWVAVRGRLVFTVSGAPAYILITLPVANFDNDDTLEASLYNNTTSFMEGASGLFGGTNQFVVYPINTTFLSTVSSYILGFGGIYEST